LFDSEDEGVRLAAVKEFMDRFAGKPVQSVESDVRTVDFTKMMQEAYLAAVSGKVGGHGAPIIEGEAAPPAQPATAPLPDGNGAATDSGW
jgi:hypothetical protein